MSTRRSRAKQAVRREAGLVLAMTEALRWPKRRQCPRCWQAGSHLVQHKGSVYFRCNPDRGYELPAEAAGQVPTVQQLQEQGIAVGYLGLPS